MSWDVLLIKEKFKKIEDIPQDFEPAILGDRDTIISQLKSAIPELDYTDKSWGILQTPEYSIEFNTGNKEDVGSIMLHVRGGGDPLPLIKLVCDTCDLAAIDCSEGEFINLDDLSSESWEKFQQYRDSVIRQNTSNL